MAYRTKKGTSSIHICHLHNTLIFKALSLPLNFKMIRGLEKEIPRYHVRRRSLTLYNNHGKSSLHVRGRFLSSFGMTVLVWQGREELAIRRKNYLSVVRIANSSLIYPWVDHVIPNAVRDLQLPYLHYPS